MVNLQQQQGGTSRCCSELGERKIENQEVQVDQVNPPQARETMK